MAILCMSPYLLCFAATGAVTAVAPRGRTDLFLSHPDTRRLRWKASCRVQGAGRQPPLPRNLGLYWEDFEPGDVFEHRPAAPSLDTDTLCTLLTLNVQAGHFDALCRPSGVEEAVVDSTSPSLCYRHERFAPSVPRSSHLAGTGEAPIPVFAGRHALCESTCFTSESRSRPTQGSSPVSTRGINQDGVG